MIACRWGRHLCDLLAPDGCCSAALPGFLSLSCFLCHAGTYNSSLTFGSASCPGTCCCISISSLFRFFAFALKITLVSATGISSPGEVGPLVVGALINESQYAYADQPQVIAANGSYSTSATSVTTTDASQIQLIGFTCNIPYWWYNSSSPSPWDPAGARISLLVEAAPGAVVITPEPATLFLLTLGGLLLRKRK